MRIPAHLVLSRHRIFYLRWPIPKALHPLQKRSHLKLSLQTRDPQQALQAARALCYLGNLLLEQGSLASMTYAEVKAILTRHFSDFMEKTKAQIAESGPLPSADVDALENSLAAAQSALDHGTSIRWGGSDRDLLTQFIGQYNLSIEPNSPQFSLLRNDLAKAYRAYCHAALEFSRSYETYDFTSLPAAEAFRASISESSTKGISLEEMAEGYFRDAKKAERWTARTEMERSEHLALLYEVWGKERDVGSLSKVDAGVIKSLLHQYPKNRNKRPETRKRPLAEALAAAGDQTLSMNTINKYLQTCSGLFHWGNKNGHVNENIFEGLTIARGKKQNRKLRNEFSREQITLLLNEVVCDPRNKIGCHKRPWRKWAPLIAVFTGARLNEIAQLEISDIRQQDDIWYFDINDNGPRKSLKNASSARKIPMHSKLIQLGLLQYVDETRDSGADRLFPQFTYSKENGWGRQLSHWFNQVLLPALNLKPEGVVLHSLRHSVVGALSQAGVEEPITQTLIGHAPTNVIQSVYNNAGFTLRQLSEAIEKLDFKFDAT